MTVIDPVEYRIIRSFDLHPLDPKRRDSRKPNLLVHICEVAEEGRTYTFFGAEVIAARGKSEPSDADCMAGDRSAQPGSEEPAAL
jgi:hypothetical protein